MPCDCAKVTLAIASVTDAIATLIGQPPGYWQGAYLVAREWNPVALIFIKIHPLAFFAIDLALLALISLLIIKLPTKIAKVIAVFLIMAHTSGASDWLLFTFHLNYWTYNAIWLICAVLIVYAFAKSDAFHAIKNESLL